MSATDEAQAGAVTATCQRALAPSCPALPGSDVQACVSRWARAVPMASGPKALGWLKLEWARGPYLMLDVLIAPTSELTNN